MQNGSSFSSDAGTIKADCVFCQHSGIAQCILKETPTFRILADHAPLVPGHTLIVPTRHYTCYGDIPVTLDADLLALKQEVQRFFARYYAPVAFWEHGIFRQTVYHAHLHCFPFGNTHYDPAEGLHELEVHSQDDIRMWHKAHDNYFYLEDTRNAFLFAPKVDYYGRIIQEVLLPGALANSKGLGWRSPQERRVVGKPFIEELQAKWQQFQQQEINYVDQTSS